MVRLKTYFSSINYIQYAESSLKGPITPSFYAIDSLSTNMLPVILQEFQCNTAPLFLCSSLSLSLSVSLTRALGMLCSPHGFSQAMS